jgi:putative phosphoribosyl transferase
MPNNSTPDIYFKTREDAVEKLIDALPLRLLAEKETVVLGISKEGVFFASEIAKVLKSQMDILLTEPIMAPNNPELAIAMVSETEEVVMHKALIDAFDISEDYIYKEAKRQYEEDVLRHRYTYRKGEELVSLKGKYVVIVDECIETGLTMMVALKSIIAQEAKNIYIATPILDKAVYQNLLTVSDGVFCPYKIEDYISIEYYYETYEVLEQEEIIALLDDCRSIK